MKTVCLVGLAPSTREDFINEPDGVEVWSLNMGHAFFPPAHMSRMTRWFQIHPREEMEPRQNPQLEHIEFLKSATIPVYMEETHPDIPMSVRYPYEDVCRTIGGNYMTSAPAFMLALAIHEGFELVKIYGIDLDCDREWAFEKSCFEHLLGIALGKGMKVWIPEGCPLLKGDLYGKTIDIRSSYVVERHRQLRLEEQSLLDEIRRNEGRIMVAEEMGDEERRQQYLSEAHDLVGKLNLNQGKLDILEELIDVAFRGPDRLGTARSGMVVSLDGTEWFAGGVLELPQHSVDGKRKTRLKNGERVI